MTRSRLAVFAAAVLVFFALAMAAAYFVGRSSRTGTGSSDQSDARRLAAQACKAEVDLSQPTGTAEPLAGKAATLDARWSALQADLYDLDTVAIQTQAAAKGTGSPSDPATVAALKRTFTLECQKAGVTKF